MFYGVLNDESQVGLAKKRDLAHYDVSVDGYVFLVNRFFALEIIGDSIKGRKKHCPWRPVISLD